MDGFFFYVYYFRKSWDPVVLFTIELFPNFALCDIIIRSSRLKDILRISISPFVARLYDEYFKHKRRIKHFTKSKRRLVRGRSYFYTVHRARDTRERGSPYRFARLNERPVNRRCNAKYLWKRIPADVKTAHEELGRVWTIGQCMWQRNWPAVHAALNVEWSEDIQDVMTALKGKAE